MLDAFEILTTSGVVLWSRSFVPIGPQTVNSLIRDVFIEGRVSGRDYKKDKYTLKWTTAKDLGLIFVAVYQSLLQLSWVETLLENVKILFSDLYKDQLKKQHTSIVNCPFDDYFDRQIQELEKAAGAPTTRSIGSTPGAKLSPQSSVEAENGEDSLAPPMPGIRRAPQGPAESDTSTDVTPLITPVITPDSSRPASPALNHLITGKSGPGKASRRSRKAAQTSAPMAREDSASSKKAGGKGQVKAKRVWNDDGLADEDDGVVLDYSAPADESKGSTVSSQALEPISRDSWTTKTSKGEYMLKELDEEMSTILASAKSKTNTQNTTTSSSSSSSLVSSSLTSISSMFRSVIGGKSLTEADLAAPMKAMKAHLTQKNVAPPAAQRLCDLVAAELLDTKTANFQSAEAAVRAATERALTKLLSPAANLDLLRAAAAAKAARRPYVVSIVGVNGVGKSTTLAKLAFLLLHNGLRVLVCAADTFRSGAVEQLRVHVRNLQQLTARGAGAGSGSGPGSNASDDSSSSMGAIELFERGYGGDAAAIARAAVRHAAASTDGTAGSSSRGPAFDVVLIDTAGRRHNDNSLMGALAPFAAAAAPDKILMVGEALVGTDSVAQAARFNAAFGPVGRALDGLIVSKCDTVGDMIGTLVSMVDATGAPVVALGVGQHYGDLRALNVSWAVGLLMS